MTTDNQPAHADNRESWQCDRCGMTFHVIVGRDHRADHAPHCDMRAT